MKLRTPWEPKPPPKRNDYQRLVNDPVEVWVGGAGTSKPKKIEVREPPMIVIGQHLAMLTNGLSEVLRHNGQLIESLLSEKKINFGRDDCLQFSAILEAVRTVIADLVGESEEYVDHEMTAKQFVAVMETYAALIGWDFIRETFDRALQGWNAAGISEGMVTPIKPPTSAEPQSKSHVN